MGNRRHYALVALLAIATHATALRSGFIWLDHAHIEDGLALARSAPLTTLFERGFAGTGFYPDLGAVHFIAPLAAPVQAIAAVVLATLAVSGTEWLAGWQFTGVNILSLDERATMSVRDAMLVYAVGIAVSLPLTLVPLFAYFEGAGLRDAFGWSVGAFVRNVPPFLLYAGLSMALLGIVFVTQGLAVPIVLPLWALSYYAAWKDVTSAG